MRARVVFLQLFFLCSFTLLAQRKPSLHLEHNDYELGVLDLKDSLNYVLEVPVRNAGKGKLRIERVEPTCECTTVELKKRVLRRGRTAVLRIFLDLTKIEKGEVMRCVLLFTNESGDPITVCLSATITDSRI